MRELLKGPGDLCLLEAGHSGDQNYQRAMSLIRSESIPLGQLRADLENLPMIQDRPFREWDAILERIDAANQMIPRVEGFVLGYEGEIENPFLFFDGLVLSKKIPRRLHLSRREYQIASANIAFRFFAFEFKEASSLEKKEELREALLYFAAMHDFLVGAKTNLCLFLVDPDGQDLSLVEEIAYLLAAPDKEEVARRATEHLVEGGKVSPVQGVSNSDLEFVHFF